MSRPRFQLYRTLWTFVVLALMFTSFTVTAIEAFPIDNAEGGLTIGPLVRPENITTARTRLDQNSVRYNLEDTFAKESLEFIVVSREYTSSTAASDDLQRLADSGIKDYLYVARGDHADRISVRVYSQHAVAQDRAATLNNFRFAFSVIERFQTTGSGTNTLFENQDLASMTWKESFRIKPPMISLFGRVLVLNRLILILVTSRFLNQMKVNWALKKAQLNPLRKKK